MAGGVEFDQDDDFANDHLEMIDIIVIEINVEDLDFGLVRGQFPKGRQHIHEDRRR